MTSKVKMKKYFSRVLDAAEENSTCRRVKVAALIVKDDRIIATGWNGVPSGFAHCCDLEKEHLEKGIDHHDFSESEEVHAEQGAIAFAARNGIATIGADMYVSISPCSSCAKLMISSGIKKVYFKSIYDRSSKGLDLLTKANIEWEIL